MFKQLNPLDWMMIGSIIVMFPLFINEWVKHKKMKREEHEEFQKFINDWFLSLDTKELKTLGLKRVVNKKGVKS